MRYRLALLMLMATLAGGCGRVERTLCDSRKSHGNTTHLVRDGYEVTYDTVCVAEGACPGDDFPVAYKVKEIKTEAVPGEKAPSAKLPTVP